MFSNHIMFSKGIAILQKKHFIIGQQQGWNLKRSLYLEKHGLEALFGFVLFSSGRKFKSQSIEVGRHDTNFQGTGREAIWLIDKLHFKISGKIRWKDQLCPHGLTSLSPLSRIIGLYKKCLCFPPLAFPLINIAFILNMT